MSLDGRKNFQASIIPIRMEVVSKGGSAQRRPGKRESLSFQGPVRGVDKVKGGGGAKELGRESRAAQRSSQ